MIAAEIDTFKESARPFMGILTVMSAAVSQKSDKPLSSLPKTIAQAPLKIAWVYNLGATGPDAQILIFLDFKNENISSGVAHTTGILNTTPVLERMTLGLYTSVCGSQTKTASTPTPSQVRKTAPRLPGF